MKDEEPLFDVSKFKSVTQRANVCLHLKGRRVRL